MVIHTWGNDTSNIQLENPLWLPLKCTDWEWFLPVCGFIKDYELCLCWHSILRFQYIPLKTGFVRHMLAPYSSYSAFVWQAYMKKGSIQFKSTMQGKHSQWRKKKDYNYKCLRVLTKRQCTFWSILINVWGPKESFWMSWYGGKIVSIFRILYQFLGSSKFGLLLFEIIHICHTDNLNICFSSTSRTLVQNF